MPDAVKRHLNVKEYHCCSSIVVGVNAELVFNINQLSGGRMLITKSVLFNSNF